MSARRAEAVAVVVMACAAMVLVVESVVLVTLGIHLLWGAAWAESPGYPLELHFGLGSMLAGSSMFSTMITAIVFASVCCEAK